jgi:prophage maintenance system killer protein
MASYVNDWESIIQAAYLKILEKRPMGKTNGKTLNCSSFRKIAEEIKSIMINSTKEGWDVFETANQIIFALLQSNFFVYENPQMAAWIGYIYLRKQGVAINRCSTKNITNNSSLDEIRTITASW